MFVLFRDTILNFDKITNINTYKYDSGNKYSLIVHFDNEEMYEYTFDTEEEAHIALNDVYELLKSAKS